MTTAATIRPAQPDDAERLAQLAERTFRDTFTAENTPADIERHCAESFGPETQRREIQDANYITILAEVDGDLVGYAQIRLNAPKACVRAMQPSELYRIYVSSEWQGRGLAHDIMRAIVVTATHAGADCLWLGVWEQNPRAIAFYGKYGFEVVGDHVFRLGGDKQRDLIMAVELDRSTVA